MKYIILFMMLNSCVTIEALHLHVPAFQVEQSKDFGSSIETGRIEAGEWCALDVFGDLGPHCFKEQFDCESSDVSFDGCGLK